MTDERELITRPMSEIKPQRPSPEVLWVLRGRLLSLEAEMRSPQSPTRTFALNQRIEEVEKIARCFGIHDLKA